MKVSSPLSTGALASCALVLGLFAQDVAALPSPKSSWVRKGRSRKAMADILNGKTKTRRSGIWDNSCSNTTYNAVTAPKANVWSSLTDVEASSVVAWLFAQPELNLTVAENGTEWDNTL